MTREEINEYLTTHLFGECCHGKPKVVGRYNDDGDYDEVTVCEDCGAYSPSHNNYFTGDGMLKVIDAMRARAAVGHYVIEDGGKMGHRVMFMDTTYFAVGDVCDVFLPEAVARAAVEFLKGEKG